MKKEDNNNNKYSKYEESEKIYHASKKPQKRKLNNIGKIVIYTLALIFSLLLVYACFNVSLLLKDKHTTKTNYAEKGSSSFKVYLNNNTYYENSYLESGMHYVADLINAVNIDYKYEIHADNKINYKYEYDIISKTVITEKNEPNNILFTKEEALIKNKKINVADTNFVIDENVDINYSKYNDYVSNYKRDYSLDVDAFVIISMNVKTSGTLHNSKDIIDKERTFDVIIPLSKKTIDISSANANVESSGILSSVSETIKEAIVFLILSIMFSLVAISLFVKIIITIIKSQKANTLYEKTIRRYLKEYDRAIIETGTSDIDETKYSQIISVATFEELLDLHDNFKYPILHYEVEVGRKSYFIIIKDNILYKLTISEAYLEKNGVN